MNNKKRRILIVLMMALFCFYAAVTANAGGLPEDFIDFLEIGGTTVSDIYHDASGNGWTYQACPRRVTLHNYNGPQIRFNQAYPRNDDFQFEIVLQGANTIKVEPLFTEEGYKLGGTAFQIQGYPKCKVLLLTGSGTLDIRMRDQTCNLFPTNTANYLVNCGKITVSYLDETGSIPFPMKTTFSKTVLYQTSVDMVNVVPSGMPCYTDSYWDVYNSVLTIKGEPTETRRTGYYFNDANNAKAYSADGEELSPPKYDVNFIKLVYDQSVHYCAPKPGEYSAAANTIVYKCLSCGKVIETLTAESCKDKNAGNSNTGSSNAGGIGNSNLGSGNVGSIGNSNVSDSVNMPAPVGYTLKDGNASYMVTGANTVTYKAPLKQTGSVVIPAAVGRYKVTAIANNAFRNNKSMKSLVISQGVTTIGNSAFQGCKKLANVTIPASVAKIGKNAFNGCAKLKKVKIKTTKLTSKKVGSKAFAGLNAKVVVTVPKASLKSYKSILKAKGIKGKNQKIKK